MMAVMSVPIVEALGPHELAQVARIGCQTSDCNSHMIIDVEHLFLMAGQIMGALLEGNKDLY